MEQNIPYEFYKPQYSFWTFNFFFLIWLLGTICYYTLRGTQTWGIASKFEYLTEEKRRNVVVYVLQIIITTVALVLQIVGGADVLFQMKETATQLELDLMLLSTQLVFVLYLWEMIYRLGIGFPLLVHHILTCIFGNLFASSLFDTRDLVYIRLALIMLLYATTEQSSFVALFCYRLGLLDKGTQLTLFTVAAVQSFVVKTAIAIFGLVYFCIAFFDGEVDDQPTNWKWFWKTCFIPLLLLLFAAQLFSSHILWQLRSKCLPEEEEEETQGEPEAKRTDMWACSTSIYMTHASSALETHV